MTIDAVFRHNDGCVYNELFPSPSSFLRAVRSRKKDELVHAVDYDKAFIIYPSTLPDYKRVIST